MSVTWLRGTRYQGPVKTTQARLLRSQMTEAESKMWKILRSNQLNGLKFRRQVPLGNYYLDFYCARLKLAIELDGAQHSESEQQECDKKRTDYLASEGVRVLRYANQAFLLNTGAVLDDILKASLSL